MNTPGKSAIAVATAAAVGGVPAADAATYQATLTQVLTYSNNGTAGSPGNITSSTATFTYDDTTNLVTQTEGLYNVRFTTAPTSTLFRTSITGLVIGNGDVASATTFVCTEGNFGGNVGASICGNYTFGANAVNESTVTYGPGTAFSRTIGGDDAVAGAQNSIASYNGFSTAEFTGTQLALSNATCNPVGAGVAACTNPGALNTGLRLTFTLVEIVTGPADDSATVEAGVPTVINVLANDTNLTDPVEVTIETPSANGATVVVNGSPGNQAGVTITYTSAPGFTGTDTFTYRVDDAGSINDTAVVTVTVQDTVPDAFTINPVTLAPLSSPITSDPVTVAGISTAVPISVTGGEYNIDGGAFTAAAGTVNVGQEVRVRQTSSATPSTETIATLTIGGVSADFSVTTELPDTIPDAFSFPAKVNQALSSAITSDPATITGINAPAPISITGGEYSINGGGFTSAAGTITSGQSVTVRVTSSAAPSTATVATLNVGGVTADFSVTTAAAGSDVQPDIFLFENQANVARSTLITSNAVTITGINAPADVRISGPGSPQFSINGGDWQDAGTVGSITNGQTLQIRHTSASTGGTATQTTITIGNPAPAPSSQRRQGNFTSVTAPTLGDGGSSAVDGLVLALLGLVGLRRRRKAD